MLPKAFLNTIAVILISGQATKLLAIHQTYISGTSSDNREKTLATRHQTVL
jgi:hypothetical protein